MKFLFTTVLLLLVFSSLVGAFGVSSPYWEGYPLTMLLDEEKIVNFNLQNMVGNEDVEVKVELKEGFNIASLNKESYSVRAGTSDSYVPLRIKAADSGSHKVKLEFKTVTPGGGGVVTGTGMLVSFDVVVSEAPTITGAGAVGVGSITISSMVVMVLIIFAIALFILRKRKR